MHEYESTGVLASFDVLYPLRYNPKKKRRRKTRKDILFENNVEATIRHSQSQSFSKLGSNRIGFEAFEESLVFLRIDDRRVTIVACIVFL